MEIVDKSTDVDISGGYSHYQQGDQLDDFKNQEIGHQTIYKQILIGVTMCALLFSVLAVHSFSKDGTKTSQLQSKIVDSPVATKSSSVPGSGSNSEVNSIIESKVGALPPTTVEVEKESFDDVVKDPVPVTKFSANRARCQKVYSNPTAVAYKLQDPAPTPDKQSPDTPTPDKQDPAPEPDTPTPDKQDPAPKPDTQTPATQKPVEPAKPGWADTGNGINVPIALLAIRCCESKNNYSAENGVSSASGAYQFLDGTWAGRYGVSRAKHASPYQQDVAALELWNARGSSPWNASKNCWGQSS